MDAEKCYNFSGDWVRVTLMKAATSLYLIKIAWRMGGLIESFCIGGGLQEIVICLSLIQKGFSTWCGAKPGHSLVIPFHSTMCNRCSAFLPRYVFTHKEWFYLLTWKVCYCFFIPWGSYKLPFCTYVFFLIVCWTRSCFFGSNAKCWRLVYLLWTIKSRICCCSSEKGFI